MPKPSKNGHVNRKLIPLEEFVRVWQTSDSFSEAVERLGVKVSAASARACSLRKKGVRLKKFHRGYFSGVSVNALNALIDSIEDETTAS